MDDANNPPAEQPESAPGSRSGSPTADSGEGGRLVGSSRNGSSSAFTVAGAAHRAGDGGSALQKRYQGASRGDANHQKLTGKMSNDEDDELPGYSAQLPAGHQNISTDPMDIDQDLGSDDPNLSSSNNPSSSPGWSFNFLEEKSTSQLATIPAGFGNEPEEDLFADDAASTRVEGGAGRSTPGMLSDSEDRMADFAGDDEDIENVSFIGPERRGIRESAPPPSIGGKIVVDEDEDEDDDDEDEDEELPVVELHPDGE